MTVDGGTQWSDPGEIRELVHQIRDGYESAPAWAQTILLAMLGFGLLVVIFRIARSLVARMIAVILAALISAVLRFYGPDLLGHLSSLLP
jgi:hypothetical protein